MIRSSTFSALQLVNRQFRFKMFQLAHDCLHIVPDDADEEVDEDTRALLTADFEIGHYIRESIVPRATLYFTGTYLYETDVLSSSLKTIFNPLGDALMEDDFDEEEEEEDGDEEGEEGEEEEEDPDFDPRKHAKAVRGQKGQANPAECKQQ